MPYFEDTIKNKIGSRNPPARGALRSDGKSFCNNNVYTELARFKGTKLYESPLELVYPHKTAKKFIRAGALLRWL